MIIKVGHNGPEEITYIEQGLEFHIEMITVNGKDVGKREDECSVNGGDG